MITEAQFNRVMNLAGLFPTSTAGNGWMTIDAVDDLVHSLGYLNDRDEYDPSYDVNLAIECIHRAIARMDDTIRKNELLRVSYRLQAGLGPPIGAGSPSGDAVDTVARNEIRDEAAAREQADADEARERKAADETLGRAIDAKADASALADKQDALPNLGNSEYWATDAAGNFAARPVPTGQGGGDVTTAQFNAAIAAQNAARATLVTRSDKGDDLQIVRVNTGAHYLSTIAAQKTSDQPLRMIVGADFTVTISGRQEGKTYGEVLEFAPRSDSPEAYVSLPLDWIDNLKHLSTTAESEAQFNAAIASNATKWTHLWIRCTKRFFATVDGNHRAREIGELYHVPPHDVSPPQFVVDTTSKAEAEAIINTAIVNGVALWARGPGQNVDGQNRRVYPKASDLGPGQDNDFFLSTTGTGVMSWKALPAATGGDGGGGGAGTFEEEFTTTVDPPSRGRSWAANLGNFTLEDLQDHESVQLIITAEVPAGRVDGASFYLSFGNTPGETKDDSGELHGGPAELKSITGSPAQQDSSVMYYTHVGDATSKRINVLARSTSVLDPAVTVTVTSIRQGAGGGGGGGGELTQAQQIGLLNIHPEPVVIEYSGDKAAALRRTIRLRVANPELLKGDIWYEGQVDGQPVLARAKWSSTTATLNFVIDASLAARIGQNPALTLQLDFYNVASGSGQGTIVESLQYSIQTVRVPREPMILQAAVNGTDTAGVTVITLPANYTDWKQIFIGVWERENDLVLETEKHTALLAAQTGIKNIHVGGNVRSRSNNNSSTLRWDTGGLTLTAQQNDRIIYAVLED